MANTVNIKCDWLRPYSHLVEFTPLNLETELTGAINDVGGAAIGDHEITVDGLDADESADIEGQLSRGVYLTVDGASTVYRLIHLTKTADEITKIWIYPKLQAAAADDAVISIGGIDKTLDLGLIGEDGVSINGTVENDDTLDETESIVETISHVKEFTCEIPMLRMAVEDFLLFFPLSFYVVKDGAVALRYGIKKGYSDALIGKLVLKSKDEPTNQRKTITFNKCVMKNDNIEWTLGKDRTKSFPVMFSSYDDELVSIGDSTATYV